MSHGYLYGLKNFIYRTSVKVVSVGNYYSCWQKQTQILFGGTQTSFRLRTEFQVKQHFTVLNHKIGQDKSHHEEDPAETKCGMYKITHALDGGHGGEIQSTVNRLKIRREI